MENALLVHWTCASLEEARKISSLLVEKQLVACATLIPNVESVYRWEGKIEHEKEVKVVLKTVHSLFAAVRDFILAECSYDVPEILATAVEDGHKDYLKWLQESVKQSPST